MQLNTVGKSDGELELWVNGQSVLHATGLQIRTQAATLFRGIHFQTFFGKSELVVLATTSMAAVRGHGTAMIQASAAVRLQAILC